MKAQVLDSFMKAVKWSVLCVSRHSVTGSVLSWAGGCRRELECKDKICAGASVSGAFHS